MEENEAISCEPETAEMQVGAVAAEAVESAKETQVIDVHAPHGGVHTWKDFFIHIATISIGLLIAIGLEQAVEYVHHRRELKEARREIIEETQANRDNFERSVESFRESYFYIPRYLAALRASMKDPKAELPRLHVPASFVHSQYTAWETAQHGEALTLMPPEEQRAAGQVYGSLHTVDDSEDQAYGAIQRAYGVFFADPDPRDLTQEQKRDLDRELLDALSDVRGVLIVQLVTMERSPEFQDEHYRDHDLFRDQSDFMQ